MFLFQVYSIAVILSNYHAKKKVVYQGFINVGQTKYITITQLVYFCFKMSLHFVYFTVNLRRVTKSINLWKKILSTLNLQRCQWGN